MIRQDSDEYILQLIREDNQLDKGFRKLMDKYQERLYWHIRKMMGNHEDANDVLQNTFIKVYRYLDNFKGKSGLYTWIYRIATNESINLLRQNQQVVGEDIEGVYEQLSNSRAEENRYSGDEIVRRLDAAVSRLPEKQKMVFQLRYFDELPYNEISQMLNTSVGGLKALYHHAVKKVESYVLDTSQGI